MDIVEKAKIYAIECHTNTNHKYDGKSYSSTHLRMVVSNGYHWLHLIPEELKDDVIASCWTHDIIEDCRQTFNDVVKETNERIAEITYALTNEKGKTREERENDKYFYNIRTTPGAIYVKLCDRIANVEYSKQTESSMYEKYKKEGHNFRTQLYSPEYKEMWDYIDFLFELSNEKA